ncbi:hypothetical protein V1511DRAFT_501756 [Dipodascopsis uninucleata]
MVPNLPKPSVSEITFELFKRSSPLKAILDSDFKIVSISGGFASIFEPYFTLPLTELSLSDLKLSSLPESPENSIVKPDFNWKAELESIPIGGVKYYGNVQSYFHPEKTFELDVVVQLVYGEFKYYVFSMLSHTKDNLTLDLTELHSSLDSTNSLVDNNADIIHERVSFTSRILQQKILDSIKYTVLKYLDAPVIFSSPDGYRKFCNQAMSNLLDSDLESHEGFSWIYAQTCYDAEFTRKLDYSEFRFEELCRDGVEFRIVIGKYVGKNREKKIYELTGFPVYENNDHTKKHIGGAVVANEITQWYTKLQESKTTKELMFREICEYLPQYITLCDNSGSLEYISDSWRNLTGTDTSNLTGKRYLHYIHPDDQPAVRDLISRLSYTKQALHCQIRFKRRDGAFHWVTVDAVPMIDSNGEVYKWLTTSLDVQDQVDSVVIAHKVREYLRCLVMNSDTSIWSVDDNYKVSMCEGMENSQFGKILRTGVDTREALVELPSVNNCLQTILTGKSTKVSDEIVFKGQYIRTRYVPVFKRNISNVLLDPNDLTFDTSVVVGVICISTDVSTRKLANMALEARDREYVMLQQKELAAQTENQLKTQFLANMSHEIRTPIAGVVGMAELLKKTTLDQEQRDYLDSIMISARKLLGLVSDILDISKIETGHLSIYQVPFSLFGLVDDIAKLFKIEAMSKGIKFVQDLNLASEATSLVGDPNKIGQIVSNLLYNSLKFTRDGSISLEVATIERDKLVKDSALAKLVESQNDKYWVKFVIKDTGIGIKEEHMSEIFTIFKMADSSVAREYNGSGLGLSICKSFVEAMGGTIGLESTYGEGTTAWFAIPFTVDGEKLNGIIENSDTENGVFTVGKSLGLNQPETGGMTVLVVEDNVINLKIAKKALSAMGLKVISAVNGKECVDLLSTMDEPPNMILMDCQMPIMDGYTTTSLLRQHPNADIRTVPIIAMTASVIAGDKERCIECGMDDYLAKPFEASDLSKVIKKWLRSRHLSVSESSVSSEDDPEKASFGYYLNLYNHQYVYNKSTSVDHQNSVNSSGT